MKVEALSVTQSVVSPESPRIAEQVFSSELLDDPRVRMIGRMDMTSWEAVRSLNGELTSFFDERSRLHSHPIYRNGDGISQGSGEKVILGGGLMAPRLSLQDLSYWLNRKGYDVIELSYPNFESPEVRAKMIKREVKRAKEQGLTVNYIGVSKAGYDGYLAIKEIADDLDTIITLGSPTNFPIKLHPLVHDFYGLVRLGSSDEALVREVFANGHSEALRRVRKISIIGQYDRIVRGYGNWSGLADEEYVIPTTHCGLAERAETYQIIAQVLAARQEAKAA